MHRMIDESRKRGSKFFFRYDQQDRTNLAGSTKETTCICRITQLWSCLYVSIIVVVWVLRLWMITLSFFKITHKESMLSMLSMLILIAESSTEWIETMQMQTTQAHRSKMLDTPLNLWRNNYRCQWVERKRKFRTLSPLERSLSWKYRRPVQNRCFLCRKIVMW